MTIKSKEKKVNVEELDQEIIRLNMNIERVFFEYCDKMDGLVDLKGKEAEAEQTYISMLEKEMESLDKRLTRITDLLKGICKTIYS